MVYETHLVFPGGSAARLVTFFLADNLIRNPPALIERLRRLNRWKVLLDETLEDSNAKTKKPALRIHLPFLWLFCVMIPILFLSFFGNWPLASGLYRLYL